MVVSGTGKTLLTFLKPFLNRQKWKRPQAHKALQNIINTLYAYTVRNRGTEGVHYCAPRYKNDINTV